MIRTLIVLVMLLTVVACGGPPADAPRQAGAGTAGDPDPGHVDAANMVEVEIGMLRDLRITTRPVESRPGGERVMLLGELAADARGYAEVGTPAVARVTRLLSDAGDVVVQGQAVAELTSPELGRHRVEYLNARSRLDLAEAALERKRALAAEKILPLREVQDAELVASEARATVRAAGAALATYGVEPPHADDAMAASPVFRLHTPVAGTIVERTIVVGQLLDPATAAFRIADLSRLWLTVHAFERDAVRIQPGVEARLTFPALPGQDFAGSVARVGREVERESRTVPIRIDVDNRRGLLRPGMSATAGVAVGATGAPILTVPVAAVQRVRNEWCVFLQQDANHFEIRRIGRGRDLGGEIEVLSGLTADERVVVDGAFLLKAQAEKGEGDHDAH